MTRISRFLLTDTKISGDSVLWTEFELSILIYVGFL